MSYFSNKRVFERPARPEKPKKPSFVRRFFGFLFTSFKRICFLIGFLFFVSIIISLVGLSSIKDARISSALPSEMIVHLNLDFPLVEEPEKPSLLDPLPVNRPDMKALLLGLDKVATDKRVKAFILSLNGVPLNITHVQELRQAVARIRANDIPTYVIAPDYGVGAGGLAEYYLAASFEHIWMHPLGVISAPGLSAETPYVRDLLDKVGVTPQFFQRKEYKTAYESFMQNEMSSENEAMLTSVLSNIGNSIVLDIAKDRGLTAQSVKSQIDKGLIFAQSAKQNKFLTNLGYGADLVQILQEAYGEGIERVNFRKYLKSKAAPTTSNKNVAYIRVAGVISLASNLDPLRSSKDTLVSGSPEAQAFYDAADSDDVSAIIVRIDSPGGTPAAAELLRKGIIYAKTKGKPVYVSMSTTAASGGYWAAVNADKIFALPATLTGSIGVIGGKVSGADLLENLDINWETVRYGDNAGFWSLAQPFNEEQVIRFNAMLDVTYKDFVTRVAEGRGMPMSKVLDIAKGRVWTGNQAQSIKLVDKQGGLINAMDVMAATLGVSSRRDITLVDYPAPKEPFEAFLELLEQQASLQRFVGDIKSSLHNVLFKAGLSEDARATHVLAEDYQIN